MLLFNGSSMGAERLDKTLEDFVSVSKTLFNSKVSDKDTHDSLIGLLKDICKKYATLIELQGAQNTIAFPGDILYYKPNTTYKFGHIETVLGSSIDDNNELTIYRDHPTPDGFIEVGMVIDKDTTDDSIYRIHYIGNSDKLIRATAAFLTKLFISQNAIDYGGICTLLMTQCTETDPIKRTKRLERLRSTIANLFTNKGIVSVCSGFSILMYQLAFAIHNNIVFLDKAVPFKAEGCRPSHIYETFSNNVLWKVTPFCRIIDKGTTTPNTNDVTSLLSSKPAPVDPFNTLAASFA